jgi:hypothetical protein
VDITLIGKMERLTPSNGSRFPCRLNTDLHSAKRTVLDKQFSAAQLVNQTGNGRFWDGGLDDPSVNWPKGQSPSTTPRSLSFERRNAPLRNHEAVQDWRSFNLRGYF